jgi:hypothetical protein
MAAVVTTTDEQGSTQLVKTTHTTVTAPQDSTTLTFQTRSASVSAISIFESTSEPVIATQRSTQGFSTAPAISTWEGGAVKPITSLLSSLLLLLIL